MIFGYRSLFAAAALVELVSAGSPVNMLQKREAVVIVKQEILEIVGYTSTVWVQPLPPSETPTPTPTPTLTPPPALLAAAPTEEPTLVVAAPVESPSSKPVEETPPTSGGSSTFSGKATFYDAGLGSCGEVHSNTDMICALAKDTMILTSGPNPNLNPRCGKNIRVKSDSNPTGVIVKIVDTCPGCTGPYDLDLSPAAFNQLGDPLAGFISVTWEEL
ncbi:hypothetical protein ABW20_dc0106658 [Dactylellina cionopaga]|nr:hypothetical protein ABW20_dc0106658 [Dactylellina cionopaga]